VFARAFYGLRGANLAALLRALVACGWFGIPTWISGQAIFTIIGRLAGSGWTSASGFGGQPWTMWLSFAAFWLIQMILIWRGINALRRFENWAAPLVTVAFTALLVYMLVKANGIGPILHQTGTLGWGSRFWPVFWPSLMAMIAFWATLSLNMPDFTRFGRGQRQQVIGQLLGLPTTMSYIAIVPILVTSAATLVYHTTIWDPVQLTTKFPNTAAVIVGLLMVVPATMSVNVAANVVSPSYDFSSAAPRAVAATVAGGVLAVGGAYTAPGSSGPFPADGPDPGAQAALRLQLGGRARRRLRAVPGAVAARLRPDRGHPGRAVPGRARDVARTARRPNARGQRHHSHYGHVAAGQRVSVEIIWFYDTKLFPYCQKVPQ